MDSKFNPQTRESVESAKKCFEYESFEYESRLVLYRVQVFRVRVEYESVSVEYESSTSRVLRIHSQKWGSSLKKLVLRVQQFSLFIAFLLTKKFSSPPPKKRFFSLKFFGLVQIFIGIKTSFLFLFFPTAEGSKKTKKIKKKVGKKLMYFLKKIELELSPFLSSARLVLEPLDSRVCRVCQKWARVRVFRVRV